MDVEVEKWLGVIERRGSKERAEEYRRLLHQWEFMGILSGNEIEVRGDPEKEVKSLKIKILEEGKNYIK